MSVENLVGLEYVRLLSGIGIFVNSALLGPIEWTIRNEKVWETEETDYLMSVISPGSVFLDVGANIGYFTVCAAHQVGSTGKVIAVEPDPENAAILGANVTRTPFPENILMLIMAAGDTQSTTTLYRSPLNSGDHRVFTGTENDVLFDQGLPRTALTVRLERLDDMLLHRLDRLDVVKIDTQGFETAVLRGMMGLLEKYKPIVLFEFWPYGIKRAGHDLSEIPALFARLGYKLFKLTTHLTPLELNYEAIASIVDGDFHNVVAIASHNVPSTENTSLAT